MTICKHLRQARKLSQSALAQLAGVRQDEVSLVERGFPIPSAHLHAIALALGAKAEDLSINLTP